MSKVTNVSSDINDYAHIKLHKDELTQDAFEFYSNHPHSVILDDYTILFYTIEPEIIKPYVKDSK